MEQVRILVLVFGLVFAQETMEIELFLVHLDNIERQARAVLRDMEHIVQQIIQSQTLLRMTLA